MQCQCVLRLYRSMGMPYSMEQHLDQWFNTGAMMAISWLAPAHKSAKRMRRGQENCLNAFVSGSIKLRPILPAPQCILSSNITICFALWLYCGSS